MQHEVQHEVYVMASHICAAWQSHGCSSAASQVALLTGWLRHAAAAGCAAALLACTICGAAGRLCCAAACGMCAVPLRATNMAHQPTTRATPRLQPGTLQQRLQTGRPARPCG
jgi:hypothetical protein